MVVSSCVWPQVRRMCTKNEGQHQQTTRTLTYFRIESRRGERCDTFTTKMLSHPHSLYTELPNSGTFKRTKACTSQTRSEEGASHRPTPTKNIRLGWPKCLERIVLAAPTRNPKAVHNRVTRLGVDDMSHVDPSERSLVTKHFRYK